MTVFVSKHNTEEKAQYLIPKKASYNVDKWLEITIDYAKNEFIARKIDSPTLSPDDWEESQNLAFPSSLLNSFLQKDYELVA